MGSLFILFKIKNYETIRIGSNGGLGGGKAADCVGFALGVAGIALAVAFPPAGAWALITGFVAGAGTGISMAGCFPV